MKHKEIVQRIAQIISLGTPFISILVVTGVVTDPVNLTKLTALVTLATPVLILMLTAKWKLLVLKNKSLFVVSALFLIFGLVSVFSSASPVSQNIYGVYGRSTGFLAYAALVIFMLGAALIDDQKFHKLIVKGFVATGFINVIYCAWVLTFGDFIGWSNPYGEILGLFGNPNFIGAFLGMFLVGLTALGLQPRFSTKWRAIFVAIAFLTFYEILKSRAVQGLVVTAGGLALVGFLFLWSKNIKLIWLRLYVLIFLALATLSIFGALQRGPFSFIYKRSVSLRGTYWETAVEMGLRKPFTGVGMDAYGDWYRRARPPRALVDTPGIETVTNAAHNVFLDFFSYGGFPLFISYLVLLTFGFRSMIRVLKRKSEYDATFVTLSVVWVCYQVQSVISINQIGLAIWGWVLTGALISYERIPLSTNNTKERKVKTKQKRSKKYPPSTESVSSGLVAGLGIIIGFLVALPPFVADNKWWSALQSRNLQKIEISLTPSYFNPSNSQKYTQGINLLVSNNLPDLALRYARAAVAFNSEDFTSWQLLYSLQNIPESEKRIALTNLKRLDPRNPDVTKR